MTINHASTMARTILRAAQPAAQSKLLRLIAVIILGLIVLVGLAVLIAWLIIKPKRVVYAIDDRSIRNFNLNNDHLNASFDLAIIANNPNHRISVYYDSFELSVAFDGQTLAFNTLEPFYQPRRNVTRLEASLEARDLALSSSMSRDLKREKGSGQAELEVRIKARIRLKVGALKQRHRTLRILCSPVMVRFSSPNSFERTYCDID